MTTVKCTMALTTVEHDDWMPQDVVLNCVGVWRTGVDITYITEDVLAPKFRRFVNEDFTNEQYRLPGQAGTIVHISCLLKLTNDDPIQVDTVAAVVPMDVASMRRSGVTFGQKDLIDSITCTFYPASVTAAGALGLDRMDGVALTLSPMLGLMGRCMAMKSEVVALCWREVCICFLFIIYDYGFDGGVELRAQESGILASVCT